jgi:DNA repair protein RadC
MPRRAIRRSKPQEPEAGALSDAELVARLISRGRSAEADLLVARRLLVKWRDLFGLPTTTRESLLHDGLSERQAATLIAIVELLRRLARAEVPERKPLEHPAAVACHLSLRYSRRDQEVMGALFLDARHRLLSESEVYRGTLHRAAVEPREILKESLLRGATGVILFHTHPSGDPTPSQEDLLFSKRFACAAEVVGIDLVDHLILGSVRRYVSLRKRGAW